jgi:hypothetical protein
LVDQKRSWSGGRATLVQTGDLVDRGPKSRAVLDLMIALQKEAPRRGGSVRVNLGNHEVMNIMGDLRYVVAADYAAFSDSRSEQRRKAAFESYSRFRIGHGLPVDEAGWMEAHPPGFIEHRQAFGPDGTYGRWLRNLHGGLSPELSTEALDKINARVSAELQAFDKLRQYLVDKKIALPFFTLDELAAAVKTEVGARKVKPESEQSPEEIQHIRLLDEFSRIGAWLSLHESGPLWYRGYDRWTDVEGEAHMTKLTQAFKVKRIVTGHTPQPDGEIRRRFGGKLFLIDTGMLSSYYTGGQASALEIVGDRVRAIYLGRQADLN